MSFGTLNIPRVHCSSLRSWGPEDLLLHLTTQPLSTPYLQLGATILNKIHHLTKVTREGRGAAFFFNVYFYTDIEKEYKLRRIITRKVHPSYSTGHMITHSNATAPRKWK